MENGNANTPSGDGWRSDDGTEDLAAGAESPTSDVNPSAEDNNTDTPAADPANPAEEPSNPTEPVNPDGADGSPAPDQNPDQDASDPNPAAPQEGDAEEGEEDTGDEGEEDELDEEADEGEEDLDDGADEEVAPQSSPRGKQEASPQEQDQTEKNPEQNQKQEGEGQQPAEKGGEQTNPNQGSQPNPNQGSQPNPNRGSQPNPNQGSSPDPNRTPGGTRAAGGNSPEQARSAGGPKQMRSGSDFKAQSPTHKPSESKGGEAGGGAGKQTKAGAAANKLKDTAKKATGAKKDDQPKQTAGQKAATAAKAAITKGVQTALKSAGIVVSARVAWIIARVVPVLSLVSIIAPLILITSLVTQDDEKAELPFDGMIPENTSGLVQDAGVDILAAATTATYTYKDPKYGQIPWSLLVALAATTSDIGRVSPWDSCVRGDTEDLLGTAQPGVAEANVVEDCDRDTPIFNEEAGVQGPLLVYTSALQDETLENVDLNRIDLGPAVIGQPTTAVEFIAYELNAIRRQMIDNEGWAAPMEEAVEDNPAYANRFWEEAVSRLPVMDPNYAVCETPEIFVNKDGVAESPEVIAAEITKLWRCELFQAAELEVARAVADEDGTFTYAPIEYRSLAVAEVVREALIVAAEFSTGGTDKAVTGPMACGMIPTGPGVGRFSREEPAFDAALQSADPETDAEAKEYQETWAAVIEAQISSDEPAGLFPMTEDTFRKYNPVADAVRCDIGANMHAAVLAFIDNAQPVELAEEEVYTPEMAIGGWAEMPWALGGDDSIEAFKENGYYRLPELSRTCKNSIEAQVFDWQVLDGLATQVGGQKVEIGGEVVDTRIFAPVAIDAAVYNALGLEAGENFPGEGFCLKERLVDDVLYANEVATAHLITIITTYDGEDEKLDAGYTEVTVAADESGTRSYQAKYEAAVETIVAATAQFAEENRNVDTRGGTARPGQDSVVERLSHTGRQAASATTSASTVTDLAKRTVNLATAIAGLYTGDARVADEPFLSAASLAGNYTSLFGSAIGSVPNVLVQAVDKAVRNQPGGCGMDAPFLLATAFEESGAWWSYIDPITGTMRNESGNRAYRNGSGAMGPFQFIESTWDTYGEDGNGDGVRDVQNVFDAAAGAMAYQCSIAAKHYSNLGNLSNESVALQVAIDYHNGPDRNKSNTDACLAGALDASSCYGETYAQKRISRAQEYRRLADMNVPLGAIDVNPNSVNGKVIAFALAQIGKPYCNDNANPNDPGYGCDENQRSSYGSAWVTSGDYSLRPGPGWDRRFGPDAYDCSGLIAAAYKSVGIDIGVYNSHLQYQAFSPVPRSSISPGDLLFYDRDKNGRIDHVSLYIGDNKMMHASSLKRGLLVDNANLDPGRGFVGAGRYPGGDEIPGDDEIVS